MDGAALEALAPRADAGLPDVEIRTEGSQCAAIGNSEPCPDPATIMALGDDGFSAIR